MTRSLAQPFTDLDAGAILQSLPHPILVCDANNKIADANQAAEDFFQSSRRVLKRSTLDKVIAFGSPVYSLVAKVRKGQSAATKYRVNLGPLRSEQENVVDVYATPMADDSGHIVLIIQQRFMAEQIDRQLIHRTAARSVSGLAAMLGHEIKNPLSGIRGAAQLLEASADKDDKSLTRLIRDESDRIVRLVDRMEEFVDKRPIDYADINIHEVLNHVVKIAIRGFGAHVMFEKSFDPSLPEVAANQDMLIQVFLNLVKNACEAAHDVAQPKVTITTRYRRGMQIALPGIRERISLPLEIMVQDNGSGVQSDISELLFDPFISTKSNGSGLGLPLVAKYISAHGGIVDFKRKQGKTQFRVLFPRAEKIRQQLNIIAPNT